MVGRPFKAGIEDPTTTHRRVATVDLFPFASHSHNINPTRPMAMANTYTSLHYHVAFSTKNRERWITPDLEPRIWTYLGGIAHDNGIVPLKIGGLEDHVHLVLGMPPTLAPSKMVQLLKGGSSKWIHDTFPALRGFGWQDGYGAFTVSKSNLPEVIKYVETQREHHRGKTFQEEFRALLDRHGIEYDERYLWG
jgi:putative transposase